MNRNELFSCLRKCVSAINTDVNQGMRVVDDFMEEALQRYSEIKIFLHNEAVKVKNARKKGFNDPKLSLMSSPVHIAKRTRRRTKQNYTLSFVENSVTEHIVSDLDESVSARTRGGLKAFRESNKTYLNRIGDRNDTERSYIRGQSAKKTDMEDSETVNCKRLAEEEVEIMDVNFTKIKQEDTHKLGNMETGVFKKPQGRIKRSKYVKESISVANLDNETLVEEAQFFNSAMIHSSPKDDNSTKELNAFVVPPKPLNINSLPKHEYFTVDKNTSFMKENEAAFESLNSKIEPSFPQLTPRAMFVEQINKDVKISQENFENEGTYLKEPVCLSSDSRHDGSQIVIENSDKTKILSPKATDAEKSPSDSTVNFIRDTNDGIEKSGEEISRSDDRGSESVIESATSQEPARIVNKENFLEKSYTLRTPINEKYLVPSSEINIEDKALITVENLAGSVNLKTSADRKSNISTCVRGSNEENEPLGDRITRTYTKKNGKVEALIDVVNDTGRITRTKSKQAKIAQEAAGRKSGLSLLARKSLNRAKITSLNKDRRKVVNSRVTPQKLQNFLPISRLHTGQKNQELMGNAYKIKTPLSASNIVACLGSHGKRPNISYLKSSENIMSTGRNTYVDHQIPLIEKKSSLVTPAERIGFHMENFSRSGAKISKEDESEKEMKLKLIKEKEEEALLKRELAIKSRQEELKRKNQMKLQLAAKQRKKLEMEKYNNIKQSEREKEEKHRQLLEERELKLKEKALTKKKIRQQKLAETEERRRLEDEARIAKLKEQEAEQQRMLLEKQKELERHEKRAQERMAEQKAKEQYELKLKQENIKMEKVLAAKKTAQLQSSCKSQNVSNPNKEWNYKARNENDYGLEDEQSELSSDAEEQTSNDRPVPSWAKKVMDGNCHVTNIITQDMVMEYMPCHEKTPDIHRMFKMTPKKRIKRTSSAIWNTPRS